MSRRPFAVIAGGGTAGHVLLALAVARALVARGHDPEEIVLVGSRRGQETVLLPEGEFPLRLLPGRGISRRLAPADLLANASALAGLGSATLAMVSSMVRRRPSVVVAAGGYASLPAGLAAALLRVPMLNVNVDSAPGAVSRLLARFSFSSAVGFEGTPLPRSVVTGAPLREEMTSIDRSPEAMVKARAALGLPESRRTVAIFGGSLGARRLNEAATSLARRWIHRGDLTLYQVTGRRNWESVSRELPATLEETGLVYTAVPFENRMALLYAASDVVVCRAGALTVAELALVGVPSVLVPLPGAPRDHQTSNARALEKVGGAVLMDDASCDADRLGTVLEQLLEDPDRLAQMSSAARSVGKPDAAVRVAELVDSFESRGR